MSGNLRTLGISPKVANPTLALVVVGVALLVAGHFLHDATLRAMGVTVLGAAGVIVAPVGFQSSPGTIVGSVDAVVTAAQGDPAIAAAVETARKAVGEANAIIQRLPSAPSAPVAATPEGPHAA